MYKAFLAGLGLLTFQVAGLNKIDGKSIPFLEKHCYDCHDEGVQKGDFYLIT